MAKSSYCIPASSYKEEHIIKKSRFIAYIHHTETRQQTEILIRTLRIQHPQCNHVCWASIAGQPDRGEISMSDDGEPIGTAGKPILNILQHSGLGEVTAAVVRYFGGIKLGAGGLIRAYSSVVSTALKNLPLQEKYTLQPFSLTLPFAMESDIRYIFNVFGASVLSCDYQEVITMTGSIEATTFDAFRTAITNRSGGAIQIQKLIV